MEPILLSILSPEGPVLEVRTPVVVLPGTQGRFEVLKDHAPLITSLEKGEIVWEEAGERKSLPIASGFVEVLGNTVNICMEK